MNELEGVPLIDICTEPKQRKVDFQVNRQTFEIMIRKIDLQLV